MKSGNVKPLAPLARPAVPTQNPTPQPLITPQDPDALLKVKDTCALVGMCAASVYRKVREGAFPKPVKIGTRCTRWRSGDVRKWINEQATK